MSLIIDYTNLLHKHGRDPEAPAVRAFLGQHKDDPVFVERAKVLNEVFRRIQAELAPTEAASSRQRATS